MTLTAGPATSTCKTDEMCIASECRDILVVDCAACPCAVCPDGPLETTGGGGDPQKSMCCPPVAVAAVVCVVGDEDEVLVCPE